MTKQITTQCMRVLPLWGLERIYAAASFPLYREISATQTPDLWVSMEQPYSWAKG